MWQSAALEIEFDNWRVDVAGIDFRGKGNVYSAHLTLPVHALATDPSRSTAAGELSGNLVVAGETLPSLKALTARYRGGIDIIYAFPLYNTGTDGWRYDDDLPSPISQEWLKAGATGRDDPDRHDKWLAWMTPRLRLMNELLAEDGVLFVSIDDNEGHRLKMLLDEIFQEGNALATLIWEKRYSPPPDVKDAIGFVHESILVYRKSEKFKPQLLPLTVEQVARYKNPDNDLRGPWKSADYTCRWSKRERPNLYYPIVNPFTNQKVYPKPTRVWAYSKAETDQNVADKLLWWGKDGKNSVPALKNFVGTIQQGMVPATLLAHEDVGHTDMASKELRELLPEAKQDGKPLSLIRHLLRIAGKPNGTVLFPFPGAAEGPQGVLLCNVGASKEESLSRKFIVIAPDEQSQHMVAERLRAWAQTGFKTEYEFCELGSPMDGDSLLRATELPVYREVARHVFRSATGRSLDTLPKSSATWLIGSADDVDVHLIYEPDRDFMCSDAAMLDVDKLRTIVDARQTGRQSIVFAAGKFLPHSDLTKNQVEFCAFPTSIYRVVGS